MNSLASSVILDAALAVTRNLIKHNIQLHNNRGRCFLATGGYATCARVGV